MSLTIEEIKSTADDEALLDKLSEELKERFPPEMQDNPEQFVDALKKAPRGLRAMAAVYPLDVSMTMDDLAWHFGNHYEDSLLAETAAGLKELGATEAAELFISAWGIVKPFLTEIKSNNWEKEHPTDYFERTGIQARVDPLNDMLLSICENNGKLGLLQFWVNYARQHPENCV